MKLEGARQSAYLRQVNYQLSMETCWSYLKFVALTVSELLSFNAKKLGARDDPVSKKFKG